VNPDYLTHHSPRDRLWPPSWGARGYWVTVDVLLVALGLLVWSQGYLGSFVMLNGSWGPAFDWLMPQLTHLGDAVVLASVVVLVFWRRNPPLVLTTLIALIITGIVVQVLKRQFFPDWNRPIHFFEHDPDVLLLLRHNERHNSFPSGHTQSLFTAGVCLCWLWPRAWMGVVWALLLTLLAYTRVYIGAHFPGDVLGGMAIGTVGGGLVLWLVHPRLSRWWAGGKPPMKRRISLIINLLAAVLLVVGVLNRNFDILAVN